MQCVFRAVHYFYYSVKSHQNTRTLGCSNFIALLSLYIYTESPQVQQTLQTFLKITFTFLAAENHVKQNVGYAILKVQ